MMNMKRICAVLCAGTLVCTGAAAALPAPYAAYADETVTSGSCGENLTWTYDAETGALTISGTGSMTYFGGSSKIPWASFCKEIKTVTFSDGVTDICDTAFFQCNSLEQVTLPDSITKIGDSAFNYCYSLTEIKLPANLEYIDDEAFACCHALKEIELPAKVAKIGDDAFAPCGSLTAFRVAEENPYFSAADGVLFNKDKTLLMQYPAAKADQSYLIPVTVTECKPYAFYSAANLEQVSVPAGVKEIPEHCFASCKNLRSASLPETLTTIGKTAFYSCTKLVTVNIPDTVTYIGTLAFEYCKQLADISIPAGVTYIGGRAFQETPWMNAKKEETPVVIVNRILLDATANKDADFIVPDTVDMISGYAFLFRKDLKSITIPDTVKIIGEWAFEECTALEQVTLPESVAEIGNGAFQQCASLERITIENKDCKIARSPATISFGANEETYNYYYGGTICGYRNSTAQEYAEWYGYHFEALDADPFSGTCGEHLTWTFDPEIGVLRIEGTGEMTDYEETTIPWYDYIDAIQKVIIGDGAESIGANAFYGCRNMTEITIPDSVTVLKDYALFGCKSLTEVSVPDGVTSIGELAFADCEKLTDFTIPAGVTSIARRTFAGCNSFTNITIPANVQIIGQEAYQYCYGLTDVTIPANVTEIGSSAFSSCKNLNTITIENPQCTIYNSRSTISSYTDTDTFKAVFNGTIRGYSESTAKAYAERYEYQFEAIDGISEAKTGDISGDGEIGADYAQMTLKAYVNILADKVSGLTDAQMKAADVDGDGAVTATDAQIILKYYVNTLAGKDVTWNDLLPKK